MEEERRLVYRVLRHWTEIARGGRLPRRDEINPYIRGEDAANCLLIAVRLFAFCYAGYAWRSLFA
jgi:hypothetical protein